MSTRAYKVIKIELKTTPSFNYSKHYTFIEPYIEVEGGCIITIDVNKVREDLADKNKNFSQEEKDILNNIVKDAGDNIHIDYFCS